MLSTLVIRSVRLYSYHFLQDIYNSAGETEDSPAFSIGKIAEQVRTLAHDVFTRLEAPRSQSCLTPHCPTLNTFECDSCYSFGLKCQKCFLEAHRKNPFHVARYWNGEYFEKKGLKELGFQWSLNHGGYSCPYVNDGNGVQEMKILDVNGIHFVEVGFCHCANHPSFSEQLMTQRVFPATLKRPRTAFTCNSLRLFQMLNHTARTTPWDFTGTMQRLTDNVDVTRLLVCLFKDFLGTYLTDISVNKGRL